MIEMTIAIRVVGTALLAIKLIGFKRNSIIKKCMGRSLIMDENQDVFVTKEHYLDMLKENLYATIGFIYMIIGEILNLFILTNINSGNLIVIFFYTVLHGILLFMLVKLIIKIILKFVEDREERMIKVDPHLVEEGVIADQPFDD